MWRWVIIIMPPSSSSPVATCYRIHHTMSWPALSPPRNATLCYLTPRYATLRYATPRHATLRHVTLRYATLRCFSSPISSSQLFLRCLPLSLSLVTCLVACVLVACLLFLSHPLFPFVPVGVSLLPPLASSRLVASRRVASRLVICYMPTRLFHFLSLPVFSSFVCPRVCVGVNHYLSRLHRWY